MDSCFCIYNEQQLQYFVIISLAVYSSLGYKNAVDMLYEEKLVEARREAQQDANYAALGDVSIFPSVKTVYCNIERVKHCVVCCT